MHKVFLSALVIGFIAMPVNAAPALSDKPPRWEFCELQSTRTAVRPQAFQPGGAAQPAVIELTIRFTTGDEEITAKTWEELADKLKAPAPKKDGTENVHRLRVFNRLGADGWEPMEHPGTLSTLGTGSWMFKRRVP